MRYRNSWMEAEVVDVQQVAANVQQIKILPVQGCQPFTVGAHLDVSILINELPEIRSYSLVGAYNADQPYTIAVKRLEDSRGGSRYMWTLKPGSKITISAPANHFELNYSATDYLLVAGGIGITPLVGMAETLLARNGVNVRMVYVGRQEEELPFLNALREQLEDRLITCFSESEGRFDVSRIVQLAKEQTQVYLCGPLSFMNAIRQAWEQSPFSRHHLRYETFGASGLFAPKTFKVKIPRFDMELEVPKNQTLLTALNEAGIDIMYDCQKGECGLCQVDILSFSGDIDHRDCFFSESEKGENKKMCACISRVANGELVIDTAYRG